MSVIRHHIPDAMLASYAAGTLPQSFSVVVAAHVSMCAQCRAALEAHQAVGGLLLESCAAEPVSGRLRQDVLAQLDAPFTPEPCYDRSGIFPGPVVAAMKGRQPKWKTLGMGVRQDILMADNSGSVRLLYIPAGQAVPDHGHNGLELTLVLQGSFSDETGQFGAGDLEVADEEVDHTPVAGASGPCICLAATDAPLRFRAFMPRLLQPLFRI
ncbi:ChrR family anti-sigma-E factor [Leisingera aquaemixtae]|uniref:ChrR family anti-sigma-E factor n=1 Tax=Leisingera TaxID=191028 RepID=UPI001C96853F|nr:MULTISPECIES: ChrR family anti-sigma-E factor [Leisingera]MBY6066666.1 ChrR family anti-sigma-E factor [Leisingera aquaemixtae]MCB4455705.1 ChrR family anti-sigma-E factor [Leisingera sp. McT4-56]